MTKCSGMRISATRKGGNCPVAPADDVPGILNRSQQHRGGEIERHAGSRPRVPYEVHGVMILPRSPVVSSSPGRILAIISQRPAASTSQIAYTLVNPKSFVFFIYTQMSSSWRREKDLRDSSLCLMGLPILPPRRRNDASNPSSGECIHPRVHFQHSLLKRNGDTRNRMNHGEHRSTLEASPPKKR